MKFSGKNFKTLFRTAGLCAFFLLNCACVFRAEASFPFYSDGAAIPIYAGSKNNAESLISAKNKKAVRNYSFGQSFNVSQNCSIIIDYTLIEKNDAPVFQAAFENAEKKSAAWELPLELSFLGLENNTRYRYGIPITDGALKKITLSVENAQIKINSFSIENRFFGYKTAAEWTELSPFVYRSKNDIIIEPAIEAYYITGGKRLLITELSPRSKISTKSFNYDTSRFETPKVSLPPGILGKTPYPITVTGNAESVILIPESFPQFPSPVTADSGLVLDYPELVWRSDNYEFFRWESFPSIIIFDFKTYEIQDKFLKRLAFFTEKKGFRGRLAQDDEIAELHGWNAHDYSASTLAVFFELARLQNFPLLKEELELKEILLSNGIIKESNGKITEGDGAVVSISRESNGYLRRMFLTHECFHGIYFIDNELREFTRQRFDALDRVSKRFILSYFDYQAYDPADEYLMQNEFMAHILQQSAGASAEYFGKTLPARLMTSEWRRAFLETLDDTDGVYPHLAQSFENEARAFSGFAEKHYGLSGGRVWKIE